MFSFLVGLLIATAGIVIGIAITVAFVAYVTRNMFRGGI